AIVQPEVKAYKFLNKLVVGSIFLGVLTAVLFFLKMYIMSHLFYDSPLPFPELWDKDRMTMAAVFAIASFLGGLLGVVLKGLFTLYKNKLDVWIIFVGPLAILFSSLLVFKIKIGGTIMSSFHGWPYPFFIHQIKDVLDNFFIGKWIFSPGSLYHYIIFDYIFYLVIFSLIYFFIKLLNKNLEIKKINSTIFLFGLLIFMILLFTSFLSVKKSYISHQISGAGNCEENSDCKIIANRAPFSCAVVVNKTGADRILKLINSFPSIGKLQCSGREKAVCLEKKCRIAIEQSPEDISDFVWQRIKQLIENCEVKSVQQVHSLEVKAVLKTGEILRAKEPKIDDIMNIAAESAEKCGTIIMATE
ncbi:MAG: hypothetical protein WC582_03005, partial [Patescibacteria group bacterium]